MMLRMLCLWIDASIYLQWCDVGFSFDLMPMLVGWCFVWYQMCLLVHDMMWLYYCPGDIVGMQGIMLSYRMCLLVGCYVMEYASCYWGVLDAIFMQRTWGCYVMLLMLQCATGWSCRWFLLGISHMFVSDAIGFYCQQLHGFHAFCDVLASQLYACHRDVVIAVQTSKGHHFGFLQHRYLCYGCGDF